MAYSNELWAECKKKCRLNTEDIELAKKLGLNPKSLIKNIPSNNQQWKAPIKVWLREIEAKRNKKSEQKARRKSVNQRAEKNTESANEDNVKSSAD